MRIEFRQLYPLVLSLMIWLLDCREVNAQNLVPNPDFEIYTSCPFVADNTGPMPCPPWVSVFSANYFNSCMGFPSGVPNNFVGYQPAHSGQGYVGEYVASNLGVQHESVRVQLTSPLVAGFCYEVSLYINLSNNSCGADRFCALFTNNVIANPNGMTPQVNWVGTFLTDTVNWMYLTGSFTAAGGEQHLYLGNFYPDTQTSFDPVCLSASTYSYYYIDDVVVQEGVPEDFMLDLGGPYIDCNQVTLDASLPGASYTWSNGAHSPSITVTQGGIYTVTVTANCSTHTGTAQVIITGAPPVVLPPDLTLCAGQTTSIGLDPLDGVYTWQDGSHSTSYIISTGGTYTVTLDDGCDLTSDFIVVNIDDPPPPFSLGPNITLCPGEDLFLSFDPALGNFTWQNGSHNANFNITTEGVYALTISNHCGSVTDQLDVTYFEIPQFSLDPDTVILCAGDQIDLDFDPGMGNFIWQDGSTNSFFAITVEGEYALTVSNICGVHSDDYYVKEISPPDVPLDGLIELCPGEVVTLDAGDSDGVIQWQDGSSDQFYIATTSGTYSVTITNSCGFDFGSVIVDIEDDISKPDLGPDVTICDGEILFLQVADLGEIEWNDGSHNPSLSVTTSGTYIVDVYTDCESYSDTIEVEVSDQAPELHLPADFSLCQGTTTVLQAGIGNATYHWSDGSSLSQLTVSSPGTYSLTVTTTCGTDADTVNISDGGIAPFVSLGIDTSVCAGDVITLSPGFSNVDTWLWSDGSDTTYIAASASQQVFVEVNNNCGVAYDTIDIGLSPAVPLLDLGLDTAICPGGSATFSIQTPNVDILWYDGSTTSDLTVSDSVNVIASISNTCGVSRDTLHVDVLLGIPNLSLGPDQTICPGEVISIAPGIAGVSYLWHDGSTNDVLQVTQEDTVILTITNTCGTATDTVEITESTNGPQLDLGPDLKACEGETITIPAGILGVSYVWQDGSTDDHFTTSSSGMYSLTVENLCGIDRDTIEVIISGLPPVADLGSDTTLCIGSSLMLSANAEPLTSVLWQDGSTANDFFVEVSGTYTLTKNNECGTDKDSIDVQFSGTVPFADLGPDTSLCEGSVLILNIPPDPSVLIEWQDGSGNSNYPAVQTGVYSVAITNTCGVFRDTIEIDFDKKYPAPDLGQDTSLCNGTVLILQSNADPNSQIEWQDGSQLPTLMVTQPGTYTLTETNECGIVADDINVDFVDAPEDFDLGSDTILCPGESLLLSAPATSNTLLWQDGSSQLTLVADQEIKYNLTISNACGIVIDSLNLSFDHNAPVLPADETLFWCEGDTLTLVATQSFQVTYLWSTGEASAQIQVFTPGTYDIDVTASCATASGQILILEDQDCSSADFFISNIFSPNGDGVNDVFTVNINADLNVLSIEGSIYDRWGDQVYAYTGVEFNWDGRTKDKEALSGVYVYNMIVRYVLNGKNVEKRIVGDVTVVR